MRPGLPDVEGSGSAILFLSLIDEGPVMARIMQWQVDWVGALAFVCGVAVIVPSLFVLAVTLVAVARAIF